MTQREKLNIEMYKVLKEKPRIMTDINNYIGFVSDRERSILSKFRHVHDFTEQSLGIYPQSNYDTFIFTSSASKEIAGPKRRNLRGYTEDFLIIEYDDCDNISSYWGYNNIYRSQNLTNTVLEIIRNVKKQK